MSNRQGTPADKGKKKEVKSSFKMAALMDAGTAKQQKINETPKEERLRDDAYQLAVNATHQGEYIFPYIPISSKWVIPIEKKYSNLQPNEVAAFYFKNNADSFVYPKDFQYFQDILVATNSVEFDTTERSGGEIAYSKATIHRVIRPDQWSGDLFKPYEMTRQLRNRSTTLRFNYFDYINAWEHAFYYENRQRKFSWWIQFSATFGRPDLPNWFITWFTQWGLYPICLPDKIRTIYEDFEKTNPSLQNPSLWFTILYQVPWIVKWEPFISHKNLSKLGETFQPIPYLGKRVLIKWWPKFEFFKNSVFTTKGLINLEPPKPPKPALKDVVQDLKSKISKDDWILIMAMMRDEGTSGLIEGTGSTSEDGDEVMQDSQDPFA